MVKKETIFIAIAISLVVGFLSGTIFTTYKLSSSNNSAGQYTSSSDNSGNAEQLKNITALELEVQKIPNNGEAWTQLGNLYYDTSQVKKAITAYSRALAILPANADILTDLGVMYRLDKQPNMALESFDKAIQTNARHEFARLNKGIVLLYDLNRATEALQAWQELLAINPNAVIANGRSLQDLMAEVRKELDKTPK
jgi:tetratricopeptide (TPR) repeat protein